MAAKKKRKIKIPPRPWNASFFLDEDEHGVRFRPNPWTWRRMCVGWGLVLFSVVLAYYVIDNRGVLEHRVGALWATVLALIGPLCFFGQAIYILCERITVEFNREGFFYEYRLLFYVFHRHVPLKAVRCFEYMSKRYNSKHTGYYAKCIIESGDEQLVFCETSDDAGWMVIVLNAMHEKMTTDIN